MIVDTETVNGNSSSIEKTQEQQASPDEVNVCKWNASNSSEKITTEPSVIENSLIEKQPDVSLSDESLQTENNADVSEESQPEVVEKESSENNVRGDPENQAQSETNSSDVIESVNTVQDDTKNQPQSETNGADVIETALSEVGVEQEDSNEQNQYESVINTEQPESKEENTEVVTETEEPETSLSVNVEAPVETAEVKNSELENEVVSSITSQTNGQEKEHQGKKVLNGTIANELIAEDYELPEVTKVKKHFESVEVASQGQVHQLPKKGTLTTNLDIVAITKAYEDVRRDNSETQWAVFKYDGSKIVTAKTGVIFSDFESQFGDEDRAYGYLRLQTGDELSKRAKFVFVTWVGPSISPLKRAKMSTDKALIKDILSNFAVELQTENIADFTLENLENELNRAGGTHYGTGV